MIHSVYKCDDFEFLDGVLTIWNAKEVAKIKNVNDINLVIKTINYDAIVCPGILDYVDKINIILFK
jgi:hypothetical protein